MSISWAPRSAPRAHGKLRKGPRGKLTGRKRSLVDPHGGLRRVRPAVSHDRPGLNGPRLVRLCNATWTGGRERLVPTSLWSRRRSERIHAGWLESLLFGVELLSMRKSNWTPSIVPGGDENDQTIYLVADNFGKVGRAWREADYEASDLETFITCSPGNRTIRSASSPSVRLSAGRKTFPRM